MAFLRTTRRALALWFLALSGVASAEPIRLNSATAGELATIEGVDTEMADAIVALREDRGRLASVEALRWLDIPSRTLDHLRDETSVEMAVRTKGGKSYKGVDEVLAEFSGEPAIRAVQDMAMRYARTNPELVDSWLGASRRTFLLPKVNLQWDKELDQSDDYAYTEDESGNLTEQLESRDATNDDKYVLKLEWRLEKLAMSSERIRVISEAQDVAKLREKVLEEVTRLYFDRRRLQVELLLKPPSDLASRVDSELLLQELTANIDALTGGGFSAGLPR